MFKIILFLIVSLSSWGTVFHYTHTSPSTINIKIVKAEPQSDYLSPLASHVFDLISLNGSTHTLVCGEKIKKEQKNKNSYLVYSNIAQIHIKNFKINSHQLCADFANYITAVFEFIDEENPILIKLKTDKAIVEKVTLPNLNPYMDRLPGKKPTLNRKGLLTIN